MFQPKVLIVNRLNWEDNSSSNTRTNLWKNYDPDKLALIYIETKRPNTICCNRFFQISEISLVRKLYKWRTKTGYEVSNMCSVESSIAKSEENVMAYVRGHRSYFFTFMREILWLFNGWKSNELRQFIKEFDPDVVWIDGSPLILMNRLFLYVQKTAKKPSIVYLMDDAYSYESCSNSVGSKLYRLMIRPLIRQVIRNSQAVFVCSPKMKKESDKAFNVNSTFLAKGVDLESLNPIQAEFKTPIKILYMGNTLLGRIYPLIDVAKALGEINKSDIKAELFVYSTNAIPSELAEQLEKGGYSHIMKPVTFEESKRVMMESDVMLFVESQEKESMNIARLSFSTKIVDYLSSGKCIFAIGDKTIAPIDYFINEDAAIVATSKKEITVKLKELIENSGNMTAYAQNARKCVIKNHNIAYIHKMMYDVVDKVAVNSAVCFCR